MTLIRWVNAGLPYISLLVCLLMLLNMFLGRKYLNMNTMGAALKTLGKKKALIVFLGIVYLAAFCATEYCINSRLPALQIKLNYKEASKGQNPNGTRFNSSDILSDTLLEEVIKRGSFGITAEELADCLYFGSGLGAGGMGQTVPKVSTEYWVSPNARLLEYGIDGRDLMNLLGDVYYEQFLAEYTENDSILNLSFEDIDNWDYLDITSYLRIKANKIYHYLDSYAARDASYRDYESGESFASLREKVGNFIEVELERYNSFVLQNGLSKDSQVYINQLDYENRQLQVDYERNMAAYNVRLEAIDLYDSQMARIVLVPTNDESEEFYMSRTKIGVDYFADEADSALQTATERQVEMENNTYAREQLAASAAESGTYAAADRMLEEMTEELLTLSEQARILSDAYIQEQRNGYLQAGLIPYSDLDMANVKGGLANAFLFIVMLGGYMVMKRARQNNR